MKTTIVVNKYGMGEAPKELTELLVSNYFSLMTEEKNLPAYICFYAEGVKLCLKESPIVEALEVLESKGVKLLICKSCLSYFNELDNVVVGSVATMVDIIGAQQNCNKVIMI